MEEKQPWATCFFTDILLSYMEETGGEKSAIDYPSLFSGIEGFETRPDPRSFLKDVANWVPLAVLRELLSQCEKISGKKDVAYHAGRSYFAPGKKKLPSLFEIIVRVLNDVRSVLICANLWGTVQTNYLKLQPFEKQGLQPELFLLARFGENAKPSLGTMHLLRGIAEGFPRLYPFIGDIQCIEEISQLKIEDIAREFPDFVTRTMGNRLVIAHRSSDQSTVEANPVRLKRETVPLSRELMQNIPDAVVVPPRDGQIEVLTQHPESGSPTNRDDQLAYQIVSPGTLTQGSLAHEFHKGEIYSAPYSRFRFAWEQKPKPQSQIPIENLRGEISQLLFNHLKQIKQAHTRMIQFNIEKTRLTLENIQLRKEIEREYSFSGIIGQSKQVQELFGLIRCIAETDVTVLIQGETGTGKELIARAIHYNSRRKAKRFVALNCAALSMTLLESELFGHEKGAFTGAVGQKKGIFEAADGGTLFLDEIGETTPSTQVKLLRVLQEGEFQRVGGTDTIRVDVRIIAATNQSLEHLVNEGRFRQDLYYRLKVFPVVVPPLRERREDIPLLISHFIDKFKHSMRKEITGVNPTAMSMLIAHSWPGNIRELENAIQRMMVVCKGDILDVADLPGEIRGSEEGSRPEPKNLKGISRESAEIAEKRAILEALSTSGGNVTKAAKFLGISRATLQNKMKAYGLRDVKQ